MFNERLERTLSVVDGPSTRSKALAAAVAVLLAAAMGGAFQGTSDNASAISPVTQTSDDPSQRQYTVPVETVGAAPVEGQQPGTSWPGEIISSGDMDVQPQREATISQLTARIGQAVERGQTIGRLAAAPIPESTATLEELARSVAEATAELDSRLAHADRHRSTLAGLAPLEVDKELELARGRTRAAQTAYASFNDRFGTDIPIVAPQSGVVSAAFKKAGDFVEPGDPVVSINSGTNRTVRFRIPGNATPPKPGEALSVIRPGFSKDPKKLTLIGVGGSLDKNGSLQADADFVEPVDWPIHGSVRVLTPTRSGPLLVSLGAVSFDDQGRSRVWVVGADDTLEARPAKAGRSVGDKIEILDGVSAGTRIVSTATEELRPGLKLPRAEAAPTPGKKPAGDGHNHTH